MSENFINSPEFTSFFSQEVFDEAETNRLNFPDDSTFVDSIRNNNGFSWDSETSRLGYLVNNFMLHLSEVYSRKNIGVEFSLLEDFVGDSDNWRYLLVDSLTVNQGSEESEILYDGDKFWDKL